MIRFLVVSLFLILATSCSSIEFVQNNESTPYRLAHVKGAEKLIEVEGVVPFYFWGLVPEKATVDFDKIFFEKGVHNPSLVKIERKNTFESVFWTLITFGLYLPEPYQVSVYSTGEER